MVGISGFRKFFFRFSPWYRDKSGATAVEFAFVGIPFFMMLIGIMETTLFFEGGNALEGAVHNAARVISTGQAQQSGDPVQLFEDKLCEQIGILVSCEDVIYEVIEIPDNSFASAGDFQPQYDDDGNLISQGFSPAGSGDVVLIRASYRYNFLTPFIGEFLGSGDGGVDDSVLLMSTAVIRNEPYEFE